MNAYIKILLGPIRKSASYAPKFGTSSRNGLSLSAFLDLYTQDLFYSSLGLNTPLLYNIHKAAGGITSIYRQIGTGCERLIRRIFVDTLGVSEETVTWSYSYGSQKQVRYLDGRIEFSEIHDKKIRERIQNWTIEAAKKLGVEASIAAQLKGIVFEIRQGYKSKDSKRQNADIANASVAYTHAYLPCLMVISSQIDSDVLERYSQSKWLILEGIESDSPLDSTFRFLSEIVGFDLLALLRDNKSVIQSEINTILSHLVS